MFSEYAWKRNLEYSINVCLVNNQPAVMRCHIPSGSGGFAVLFDTMTEAEAFARLLVGGKIAHADELLCEQHSATPEPVTARNERQARAQAAYKLRQGRPQTVEYDRYATVVASAQRTWMTWAEFQPLMTEAVNA